MFLQCMFVSTFFLTQRTVKIVINVAAATALAWSCPLLGTTLTMLSLDMHLDLHVTGCWECTERTPVCCRLWKKIQNHKIRCFEETLYIRCYIFSMVSAWLSTKISIATLPHTVRKTSMTSILVLEEKDLYFCPVKSWLVPKYPWDHMVSVSVSGHRHSCQTIGRYGDKWGGAVH